MSDIPSSKYGSQYKRTAEKAREHTTDRATHRQNKTPCIAHARDVDYVLRFHTAPNLVTSQRRRTDD